MPRKALTEEQKEKRKQTSLRWAKNNPERTQEIKAAFKKRHPRKTAEYCRNWAGRNELQEKLRIYKKAAEKRGYEWALSKEEFEGLYQGECYYCGVSPARGVDRFLNELGYTTLNCEPCCRWCNNAKHTQDFEVMLAKCRAIAAKHALIGTFSVVERKNQ
jgi:hypothetical protein